VVAVLLMLWTRSRPIDGDGTLLAMRECLPVLAALGAAWCGWWARFGEPLEFDRDRQALVRGRRVITPFSSFDHVALIVFRNKSRQDKHVVEMRHKQGLAIGLGWYTNDLDASSLAARVASEIDKPVRLS
jgi:hypothetical protein